MSIHNIVKYFVIVKDHGSNFVALLSMEFCVYSPSKAHHSVDCQHRILQGAGP